jgi:imidazolonepropionase-like amidohydrolase
MTNTGRFLLHVLAVVLITLSPATTRAQQPARTTIFRNVDVFDGSRTIRHTNVLIRDGIIRSVNQRMTFPATALIVDGRGKTLLPGFFDSHVHLGSRQIELFLRDALDFGVTTELEMWGSAESVALRKKMVGHGLPGIADLRTAATGITVPKGHPTQMGGPPFPTLGPDDDVQAFVDARITEGADYIKIIYEHAFPTLTKKQLADVVDAAHRRRKLVVVHISAQTDARDAIAAGVDGLAHIFADSAPQADFAEFAAAHHVFVIATLSVLEMVTGAPEKPWWQDVSTIAPYLTTSMKTTLEMKFPSNFGRNQKLTNALAAVRALQQAGVPILAGTDAPAPGLAHGISIHRELELLVNAGLTPRQALTAATSAPATAFGFQDRGRIRPGLRADLVLVNGDPTVDIKATHDIVGIWKLGVPQVRATPSEQKN